MAHNGVVEMPRRDTTLAKGVGEPQRAAGRRLVLVLVAVGLLIAGLAALILINGRSGSSVPPGQGPIDQTTRPSAAPAPNDGWFVEPPGVQMTADDVIADADRIPLYVDDAVADAIVAAGFRGVRMRSYQTGTTGGGSARVIHVEDPEGLLDALRQVGEETAAPYPDLPRGWMSRSQLQVESTRAHDVWFHFRAITFFSDPYVVQIQMHATAAGAAQRRAIDYAEAEHELLQSRTAE